MSSLFTYSPKEVTISIGGYSLTGWDNLSVARSVQGFVPIRGIRGKNTRVRNMDTSATITLPLLQTSMGNDVLSRIHALDLEKGTGRLDITLKDSSGTSVFSSSEAYILGFPVSAYSGNFEYRVWQIFAQSTTTYTVGGNGKTNNIFDSIVSSASNLVNNVSNLF
jgi:hypothetical protein